MFHGVYPRTPLGLYNVMRPLAQDLAVCVVYGPVAFLTTSGAIMGDLARATLLSLRRRVLNLCVDV